MFKKFAFIACTMSLLTFGTEAIYRFGSKNDKLTNDLYTTQSNMVLATSAMILIMAAHIIKLYEIATVKAMRLIALISIGLLLLSIALRSKYKFFIPIQRPIDNLYDTTSSFICVQIICWIPFFIYKNVLPIEQMPSLPLTEEIRRRSRYEQRFDQRNNERNMAATRSDDINYHSREGETLPSYYELPSPPVYTKINIPENGNNNEAVQEQHTTSTFSPNNSAVVNHNSTTNQNNNGNVNTDFDTNNNDVEMNISVASNQENHQTTTNSTITTDDIHNSTIITVSSSSSPLNSNNNNIA